VARHLIVFAFSVGAAASFSIGDNLATVAGALAGAAAYFVLVRGALGASLRSAHSCWEETLDSLD